jgi:zinc protease
VTRFDLPAVGPPTPVSFPRPDRTVLENGLALQVIHWPPVPAVSAVLVIPGGSAADPADRPGLMGLVADMIDEGAGERGTIQLAEALEALGTRLEIDVSADATTVAISALSRQLEPSLRLLADIVLAPRLDAEALARVRDLRVNRLRQLSRTPSAAADRALVGALFDSHPYGHGVLGTTRALEAATVDEIRTTWRRAFGLAGSTLVMAGDVTAAGALRAVRAAGLGAPGTGAERPGVAVPASAPPAARSVLLVERPGAPQSELRVGQAGPARRTPDYHALVTLNALLGGQFTSRINRNLRETRGITYGARTAFEFRRSAGTFACDASVQADATAVAVAEVLRELDAVRAADALQPAEVAQAKASLTRGYVRGFETARQLARSAAHLAMHELPDDTFDRFVPAVEALHADALADVARRTLHPDQAAIVVVGDRSHAAALEAFGEVRIVEPEF